MAGKTRRPCGPFPEELAQARLLAGALAAIAGEIDDCHNKALALAERLADLDGERETFSAVFECGTAQGYLGVAFMLVNQAARSLHYAVTGEEVEP